MKASVFDRLFRRRICAFHQHDSMDCGPTCLKIVAKHYAKDVDIETIRKYAGITREGVSLFGLDRAAQHLGFKTTPGLISAQDLARCLKAPCIIHWNQRHFMVCYKVRIVRSSILFYVVDPAQGYCRFTLDEFRASFESNTGKGTVLFLSPGEKFMEGLLHLNKQTWTSLLPYALRYKSSFIQVFIFLFIASVLGFLFPILTQKVVDTGIQLQDKNLILLIIIAQVGILISRFISDFLRSWLLLRVNTKINILLLSAFLHKLVRLPIAFFDSKNVGDIMQRIEDNSRIEKFLTGESFLAMFSILNIMIFSALLCYYKFEFFLIAMAGNTVYILWVISFLKYRRELDNSRFAQASGEQSKLIQLITGIAEIKINRRELKEIGSWEKIQANLYRISIKGLLLHHIQRTGGLFFSQFSNLAIIYFAAVSVTKDQLTLGGMMSIMYIVGQLSAPIEQLILFTRAVQDTTISLERINEIHLMKDEYEAEKNASEEHFGDIRVNNLSFSYNYPEERMVVNNLSVVFPKTKVTAIVGASGSGKTTLMKLLLGFYRPTCGEITIGGYNIVEIAPEQWRNKIGAVLQDGFIFSNTIAENIALSEPSEINLKQVINAAKMACIHDYIDILPLKYNTRIGMEGSGLSQGQKQRILIARMIYKNPSIVFLDEATNSLDANNEQQIMDNLRDFCRQRTSIVIAHRLSTVKDADNIIVMDHGSIIEQGTHEQLINLRGAYYRLIQNQLELGS